MQMSGVAGVNGAPGLPPSRKASADRRSLGGGGQTPGLKTRGSMASLPVVPAGASTIETKPDEGARGLATPGLKTRGSMTLETRGSTASPLVTREVLAAAETAAPPSHAVPEGAPAQPGPPSGPPVMYWVLAALVALFLGGLAVVARFRRTTHN